MTWVVKPAQDFPAALRPLAGWKLAPTSKMVTLGYEDSARGAVASDPGRGEDASVDDSAC